MNLEVNTSIPGLAGQLAALARTNILDLRERPELWQELSRRIHLPPGKGFKYRLDKGGDRWSSFAPLAERTPPDKPIIADCEDLAAIFLAYGAILHPRFAWDAAIAQPADGEMAHAFLVWGEDPRSDARTVQDPSVTYGMKAPKPTFYRTGNVARSRVLFS